MSETTSTAPATEELAPIPARRVAVWPHTLGQFDHFDNAVAVTMANGGLLVYRWGDQARRGAVPLKGYAPGAWVTFEHLGGGYAEPEQQPLPSVQDHADRKRERAAEDRRSDAEQEEQAELAPRSRADDPDPFVQLAPEALEREHRSLASRGHRKPRMGQLIRTTNYSAQEANSPVLGPDQVIDLGEDGDDEAFRQSSDNAPLDEGELGADTGGVAQRVRAAWSPVARLLRGWLQSLSWPTVRRPLLSQPHWYTSSPVLTALVISLIPVVVYLQFSSN